MRGAMCQGVGLAGAGAGQYQQGPGGDALVLGGGAKGGRAPLRRIERIERAGGLGLHHKKTIPLNCIYIQIVLRNSWVEDRSFEPAGARRQVTGANYLGP